MKAAIFKGKEKIKVEDVPKPKIGSDEVLLKVKTCSICGTDRKIYKFGHSKIAEGEERILGHEITGVIAETGENVEEYSTGMRVVVAPNVGCGHCHLCRRGLEQLCADYNAFGISWPGGFAEYVKIPASAVRRGNLVELPDKMSFEKASVLEPLACCYNAYEAMDIKPGDYIMIFGAGPMGILHLVLNKFLGSGKAAVVDIDEQRLELSRYFGADYTFGNDGELKDRVMEVTDGRGFDTVITAAPVPVIQEQALELVATGGNICYFAGLPAGKEEIKFNSNTVHYKQLRVTGTTGASLKQFRRTVKLAESDKLDLQKIVTKKIRLEELETIFDKPEVFSENVKIIVDYR